MTIAELRAILVGLPDDMLVVTYDEGYPQGDSSAEVGRAKITPNKYSPREIVVEPSADEADPMALWIF